MALLDEVKMCLRTRTTTYDKDEIIPLICACKKDLKLAGVDKVNEKDPLVRRAIILYAKAQFGWNEDSERWQKAYDNLKNALALSEDYHADGQ